MSKRMRRRGQGRTAVTRSMSLEPEMVQAVDERVVALRPSVRGFSHYVQLLITADLVHPVAASAVFGVIAAGAKSNPEPSVQIATVDLLNVLKLVHAVFPLAEAGLTEAFTGSHCITLAGDSVRISVWWRGKAWPIIVTEVVIDETVLRASRTEIERLDVSVGKSVEVPPQP